MSSSHIFYIPLLLMIGLVVGTVVGRRSIIVQRKDDDRAKQSRIDSDAAAAQQDAARLRAEREGRR